MFSIHQNALSSLRHNNGSTWNAVEYLVGNQNRALIATAKQSISVQVQEVERLIRQCLPVQQQNQTEVIKSVSLKV